MMPEHLLFWIAPLADAPVDEPGVLCSRHADAMVVPRGWTLDDRREGALRLFKPRTAPTSSEPPPRRPRRRRAVDDGPEQLVIDGTGEIERPSPADVADEADEPVDDAQPATDAPGALTDEPPGDPGDATPDDAASWTPDFDHDDDLGGLLEVRSPLLARAFRGTDRPRS
jgi:hypothetical protein